MSATTRTRTLLGFLVVITTAFYFLMDRLTERVERQYLEAAEEPMVDAAHLLAAWLEQEYESDAFTFEKLRRAFDNVQRRQFEARIYSLVKTSVVMNIYVTDARGRVVFDSRNGLAEGENYITYHDVSRTLRGAYGARSTRTDETDEFSSIMHVGAPIRKDGEIIGMVSVAKPQASMFHFIAETRELIWLYGWTVLLGVVLATILLSHWFFRPIRKLTGYAQAVRRGERVALPKLSGPDVRMLGDALEEMRDSLENRNYVESYVQSLTHEMKGPVAAIRGAAELLQEPSMPVAQREKFLDNIRIETERVQNVIDRLLALSAIESMRTLSNPAEVVVSDLLDDLCVSYQHAFEARQLVVRKVYEGMPVIQGEVFLLEIAMGNLLQNAINFSPRGGTITLSARRDPGGGHIGIAVEDEGPGIPDYALERVFERFYSLPHPDTGRKSSGLGLCFVREAAELHGGTATLKNRPDQQGAKALLTLKAD